MRTAVLMKNVTLMENVKMYVLVHVVSMPFVALLIEVHNAHVLLITWVILN